MFQSSSAFSIHSSVSGFIQHLSAFDDLLHKTVANLQAVGQFFRRVDQHIHRERQIQPPPDRAGLLEMAALKWHHDQQINVQFQSRVAVSVGAEEDDLARWLAGLNGAPQQLP